MLRSTVTQLIASLRPSITVSLLGAAAHHERHTGIEEALRVLEPHWAEIEADFNRHNERFLRLAAADHEAIGKVLKAHLAIEAFLGDYLSEHLGIDDLQSLRLTFFQKATLLPKKDSSAAFVRPDILQINAVRNKLGHRPNYAIEDHEVSAVYEALTIARAPISQEARTH